MKFKIDNMSFCELQGKSVLVTGASSGIGMQAAISISRQGGKLIITGRNEEKLAETFDRLEGSGHQMIAANLIVDEDRDALIDMIPDLDGVVYCAGIVGPTPAKYIRQDDIKKMFGINFKAPVLLSAAILKSKKLKVGASIVMMSSVVTESPYYGGALYASSKGAVEAYTKTLALELVDRKVRVNCISPGLVNTPLITDPAKESNVEIVDDSIQRYVAKYPMGIGEAEDVANTIVFLLADESRWISGTKIEMGAVIR
ncbi:MAG: 3-oxoacyl-ACP reductase [Bacteroidetes bacterium]|nr:MAG: 3-oxoacyl-ACP reductase [Bacteroidota bacterium]